MSTAQERIQHLLEESSRFNGNDVLVNAEKGSVYPFDESHPDHEFQHFKLLLNQAFDTQRESGVLPLCVVHGLLFWEFNGTEVKSPLVLFPAEPKIDKVRGTVSFELNEEQAIINPFVYYRLKREFGRTLSVFTTLDALIQELHEIGFVQIDQAACLIGNFHHHRFEVIRELEELLVNPVSPNVAVLLGEESESATHLLDYSNQQLFPSDPDQTAVYTHFTGENCVVQGPPGTGKSQVLSNLLGKLIHSDHSVLVVSEKRVALEVLKKKLSEFGLDDLCFISTSETITRDVLHELRSSWNILEQAGGHVPVNLLLSEQYTDQLRTQLALLNDASLFGGVGYSQFQEIKKNRDLSAVLFQSDLPETSDWLKYKATVNSLFSAGLTDVIGKTQAAVLRSDALDKFDRSLQHWINQLETLQELFRIETWQDLHSAMKKAALCQLFTSADFLRFESVLTPESKEQKRFRKLYKNYLKEKSLLSTIQNEENNWILPPSASETETMIELLKDKSMIGRWRFSKYWKRVARIPSTQAEKVLLQWRQFIHQKSLVSQIEVDFCDLGITQLPQEAEMLHAQLSAYRSEDHLAWQQIPLGERSHYAAANVMLSQLYNDLRLHFRLEDSTLLIPFLRKYLDHFERITTFKVQITELSESVLRNLAAYHSAEELELAVLKSNEVKMFSRFPGLSQFQPETLLELSHAVITQQKEEALLFAAQIRAKVAQKFAAYHEVLRTPSARLNSAQKELKAELKKGKAILIKEFGKTKRFPSLRELFASEAGIWIRLLKPIWLSNPSQVARCFPMDRTLFDAVIFDEASQIPLQNALGAIQRSRRVLVAGDSQQMGPASYFKSASEEVIDVLHQASFHWKKIELKHHYRSEHPGLIAFSNKHFYKNSLVTYPSANQAEQAITWHFTEQGMYNNRINLPEAKEVASTIRKFLPLPSSIGIVAFSEVQLSAIYDQLSAVDKQELEQRIENGTLFFKALENVQGEECDHLIISLGYGKDPDGQFHMRFGPINTKNGPKRLNVLFTRARKTIDFFSSVKGEEFQISSNEAVDLLRQYLLELGSGTSSTNAGFPFGLSPKVSNHTLSFRHIHEQLNSAEELITLVRVLEGRGWKIELN